MKLKKGLSILTALVLSITTVLGGVSASGISAKAASNTPAYRNVMYYGEWSIYSGQKNFYPSKIDGSNITHLNFAFLDMDANGNLVLCDEHADFLAVLPEQSGITYGEPYAGVLGAMSILRSKYPNMKIGISVGGWTRSGDFSAVAADPSKRANFAKNIAKFVDYLGYDFVDIDWEYPTAVRASDPEGNGVTIDEGCKGSEADTVNFTLFLQSIRNELDALEKSNGKHYELSVAMSASPAMMAKVQYDKVLKIVDFANMMTYDLNGAWNGYTGHQTALYTNPAYDKETQKDGVFSVDTCIQYLKDTYGSKIDYSKIVIGVAPYTRGWAEVKNDGPDSKNPGLYATAKPNSVKAADGVMSGTFAYGEIDTLKNQFKLKEYYDETAQAAYYYSAETGYFFTCDNERSVAAKGKYVKDNGLGGLISWMASLDSTNSLTQVMKDSLYGNSKLPAQEIKVSDVNAGVTVSASGSTYTITIKNNESAVESNTALKDAELFKKTITYPKLYIETKSKASFSAGSQAGSVTNQDGKAVIDLSAIYAAKSMKPGTSHTFTVNVNGTADVNDIVGITMTRRVLTTLPEFGAQAVYGAGASGDISNGSGNTDSGNTDSGNTDAGNTDNGNTDTGNTDAGNTDNGNTDAGNTDSGNTDSGNTDAGNTNPGSGQTDNNTSGIPSWNASSVYVGGDQVVYNGTIYKAGWWTQGENPEKCGQWGVWRVVGTASGNTDGGNTDSGNTDSGNTDSGNTDSGNTDSGNTDSGNTGSENQYTDNGVLPAHMVTGYWHNFCNGSTNLKLSDVPEYYDMICVAFTGNTATPGEVTFELDKDLCNALGGYNKAQFIQDIKNLKAKGQHVIISVGGAEGRITINDNAAANRFANGLINIIEEYGFEGVDIDLEGGAVAGVNYIASALRTVHDHFGDNFIITMAPETIYVQNAQSSYLKLALEIKDILTICYPQFYNSGSMIGFDGRVVSAGTADFLTSLSEILIGAGLRADQVAFGVPCTSSAAGSGYVSTSLVDSAIKAFAGGTSSGNFTAPSAHPTVRGVMTWSINWDATQGYAWAKAMAQTMDDLDAKNYAVNQNSGNTGNNNNNQNNQNPSNPGNQGNSSSTDTTGYAAWNAGSVYVGGDMVSYNGHVYKASWWTQGENPASCGQWGVWKLVK